jgi:hypothetical protein
LATETNNNIVEVYANIPQYLFALVNARKSICNWARGTGKTEGPVALRMRNAAVNMPKAMGTYTVPSYNKFMDTFWPALKVGLARLCLYENDHFVFGERPKDSWLWDKPFYEPDDYKYFISFANGHCVKVISQDFRIKGQGQSIQYDITDEAKLINEDKRKEHIVRSMRGLQQYFKHVPEYRSELICSDKFMGDGHSPWFLKFKADMDEEGINDIINVALAELKLRANGNVTGANNLKKHLDGERCKHTYFSEASAIDNIHALGIEYFLSNYTNSTPLEFLVSLLGHDMVKIEGGFYAFIDEKLHGDICTREDYWNNLENHHDKTKYTCERDSDVDYNMPLELSLDFGGNNNFGSVSQCNLQRLVFRTLKDLHGSKYEDVLADFVAYYEPFRKRYKVVEFWCDPQGNKEVANSKLTYAEDCIRILRNAGWQVVNKAQDFTYISHNDKFNIWKKVLYMGRDRDGRYPVFKFNHDNAYDTFLSMSQADSKQVGNETKKVKRDEKNKSKNQLHTTHRSDCIDNPVCAKLLPLYRSESSSLYRPVG